MKQSGTESIAESEYRQFAPALAPRGILRVSINTGNAILARRNPATNEPEGLSVDIARHLAKQLRVDAEWVVTDRAADAVTKVSEGTCDLGFFAVDPARADHIAFSRPYLLIEGSYVVKEDSPITGNEQVDASGNVVLVSKGSAYDHYLTRNLQNASIDRSAGPQNVIETFLQLGVNVAAGIRAQLADALEHHPGLRLLDGRFMEIPQALGIPKTKGTAAGEFITRFVRTMMTDGTLEALYAHHRIKGAVIAPVEESR